MKIKDSNVVSELLLLQLIKILKNNQKKQASQQTFDPSCFDRALVTELALEVSPKLYIL